MTTFLNFPMQANSAELMRLIFVRSSEIRLIGCAHDSFLIEDTIDRIEQSVAEMRAIIRGASRDLFGFELRIDCDPDKDIVRYPDRFVDEREREDGMRHWNWLMELINEGDDDAGERVTDFRGRSEAVTVHEEEKQAGEETQAVISREMDTGTDVMVHAASEDEKCTHDYLALIVLAEAHRVKHSGYDKEIVLSRSTTGMSPTNRKRAIRELRKLGLIRVKRDGRQAPRVSPLL